MKRSKLTRRKTKTVEARKRAFIYRPLKDDAPPIPETDFHPEAYAFFKSINWDTAWKEFITIGKDGAFKHRSSWGLCHYLVDGQKTKEQKNQAYWIYSAIGPRDPKRKAKPIVPYLGDWAYMRSQGFLGEVKKESLLFGNPKMLAVREMLKKQFDVLEISKQFGELLMTWLARYDNWADQIDERFGYKLFDPKLNDAKNKARFDMYTKMQDYAFSRTLDCIRQILKCSGVGENDMTLLAQMMIASMRDRLGNATANMMMAAASGIKQLEGGGAGVGLPGDQQVVDGTTGMIENNPALKTMFGTFVAKAKRYDMEHPDINIDGVHEEDVSTTPSLKNGKSKVNGKHRTQ